MSLGQSGVYAADQPRGEADAGRPLAEADRDAEHLPSDRPYLDLTYQLLGIVFTLVPVALALWLLAGDRRRPGARRLGLDGGRPGRTSAPAPAGRW